MDERIVHNSHSRYEPVLADHGGCTYISVMIGGEFIMWTSAHTEQ